MSSLLKNEMSSMAGIIIPIDILGNDKKLAIEIA